MRIVTRPDFDGVVCAVLLREVLNIKEPVKWVEPAVLLSGGIEIRKGDVIANLPYDDKCSLWFDHHYTNRMDRSFKGVFRIAPSAAGIIFEYYKSQFVHDFRELVTATDKIDSADLTLDQVLYPEKYGYVLLSMTVSEGGYSNEPYWNKLVDLIGKYDLSQVLKDLEVKERCQDIVKKNEQYAAQLKENTYLEKHVSITDFRQFEKSPSGNRFLVYSLFPESFVNVRIRYEESNKEMVTVNVGHSIFNPQCNVNAGLLLANFEGGGHRGAASTRFPVSKADEYILQIIEVLKKNECNEK